MGRFSAWRLPPALVRAALAGHSTLGLTIAALLFLVALTGTIAMFVPELDRLQGWNEPVVERVTPGLAAQATASLPGGPAHWRRITLEYPTASLPRLLLSVQPTKGEPQRYVADDRGRLTKQAVPWSNFLIDLHAQLAIPDMTGFVVVGLLGMAMLALATGGLIAHPRLFRDAFQFRPRAEERVRQADLHNRLSVWALPFHLTIAFSGALLALSLPISAFVGKMAWGQSPAAIRTALLGPSAAQTQGSAPTADLAAILARIGSDPAGIQRVILDRPGTAGQIVRVDVSRPGRLAYGDRLFFRGDGTSINPSGMLDTHPGLPFLNSIFALHFGTFGGIPLRIIYGLLGTCLCTVIASGVRIWLARQRQRGNARPRLEGLWRAWIWGSPFALALSYAGTVIGLSAAPFFFAALLLIVGRAFLPS